MRESDEQRERAIRERARALFVDSVGNLDGRTRSRLARARASAVDAGSRPRHAMSGFLMLAVGTAAAAIVAAAVIWPAAESPPGSVTTPAPAVAVTELDDWELLLGGENLDLYEELEFYAWLLQQPEMRALADEDGSG